MVVPPWGKTQQFHNSFNILQKIFECLNLANSNHCRHLCRPKPHTLQCQSRRRHRECKCRHATDESFQPSMSPRKRLVRHTIVRFPHHLSTPRRGLYFRRSPAPTRNIERDPTDTESSRQVFQRRRGLKAKSDSKLIRRCHFL